MSSEPKKFEMSEKLKDFEILSQVVKAETTINDLDKDTKLRLIEMCSKQLQVVNRKINETWNEKENLKRFL